MSHESRIWKSSIPTIFLTSGGDASAGSMMGEKTAPPRVSKNANGSSETTNRLIVASPAYPECR